MKQQFNSKLLRAIFIASMIVLAGCGSNNDDDDDPTIIFLPEQQQREEGPVATGPSVIVNNRVDNDVKIINKNIQVVENNLNVRFNVTNVDAVIHQQYIYVAPSCEVIRNDLNGDNVVDQVELEGAVGTPVVTLEEAQGTTYQTQQQISVADLPLDKERFILVIYGSDEGATYPVICSPFTVSRKSTSTTPTTTTSRPTRTTTTRPTTTTGTPDIQINNTNSSNVNTSIE